MRAGTGSAGDLGRPASHLLLAGLTLLGLALRLHRLGSDLWLDEIAPLLAYGDLSPLEVLLTYSRPNNHLLNTLLVNAAMDLLGPREWAIRLPAALFGALTVPAIYQLSRLALSRWASLGAALLLAVSYHGVFFSQNARGYAGYLLFGLLATTLLVRGLDGGDRRTWILYSAAMILAFASLLLAGFVFAGHLTVAAAAALRHRRERRPGSRLRRAAAAFSATGVLVLLLYAPVLPRIYAEIARSYTRDRIGFEFAPSASQLAELLRVAAAGFGPGGLVAALAVAALAAVGLAVLWRRRWQLALSLALPAAYQAAFLALAGATFYPRFFAFLVPVGIVTAVAAIFRLADATAGLLPGRGGRSAPGMAAATVSILAAVSLASLPAYYRTPKQPYRSALRYLQTQRQAGVVVVALDIAEAGLRFYGPRFGFTPGENLRFARSRAALEAILAEHPPGEVTLVTTFQGTLPQRAPGLAAELESGWRLERSFPATVGDGEVRIWRAGRPPGG